MDVKEDESKWQILNDNSEVEIFLDVDADEDGKIKRRTYRMSNFIKIKNSHKYRFIGFITSVIITIILIIILVTKNWTTDEDTSNYSDISDETIHLIVSGTEGLTALNVETKNKSTFYKFEQKVNVYETYGEDKVFWFESNTSKIWYFSIIDMKKNSSVEYHCVLLEEPRVTPQDITYDHIGNNLYAVDKLTGVLFVINIKTKHHDILMTDLIDPHHIDVDPNRGLIFILQQYDSILKGNMDGTSIVKIFESNEVSALTVDRTKSRIYCLTDVHGIKSFNYYGKDIETYPVDANDIVDLAIVNDQLFWLWEHNRNINETHHLISCKIKNGICQDHSMHVIDPIGDLGSIKVVYSYLKDDSSVIHPCQKNNGGCEHICLIVPDGKSSCVCKLGWQLNPNKKTCQEVKDFILYIFLDYFRGRIIDVSKNTSIDVIWPTPTGLHLANSVPFDYDLLNDVVYFSYGMTISSTKLKTNWTTQSIVLKSEENSYIKDIVFDWLTGNLYYLQNELLDGYKIIVFNVKRGSKYNKTIVDTKAKPIEGLPIINRDEGVSLTIHPKLGYLFYVTRPYLQNGFIYKMTMNGSLLNVHTDFVFVLSKQKILAVDYTSDNKERLYWLQQGSMSILHANLNFTDKKVIYSPISQIPQSISLYRKNMYISTYYSIWRVDKATGKVFTRIAPILDDNKNRKVAGMKIVSEVTTMSMMKEEHPCNQKKNGGCEQLCLLYNEFEAVCECRDGESIGTDGYCHVDRNKN